ncbi:MAG: hypothetical protein IKE76_09810 [Clostridia bacterium]|nr:hypothetical protein [Clostridia bacterium]
MKKIIALLLSLMMLLGMAAFAEEATEPALVCCLSNIVIETTTNGETTAMNLEGLETYLSLDTSDGLALVAQAFNGDDSLLLALAKVVGTQMHLGIEGMDKTYVADVPNLQGQDTAGLGESIRPMLPALLDLQLPMIDVGSLPKLDLVPVVSMVGAQTEGDITTFSVPSEIIDAMLDQILEVMKGMDTSVPGMEQALAMLEQLRASGMSVALSGQVVNAADRQTTTMDIYPVTNGQTAESAVMTLTLTSAEDDLTLAVDVNTGEQAMNVAQLQIQTEAATKSLVGTLDIAGMMKFNLALFQEGGLQKAALTMESSMDASFALTLAYGKDGGQDMMDISFAAGENAAFEIVTHSAADAEGAIKGNMEISAASDVSSFHVTADLEKFLGSLDLGGYALPAETAPIEELQSAESSEALQTALAPVIEYFGQVMANAAA